MASWLLELVPLWLLDYLIGLAVVLSSSVLFKQLFRWFPGTDFVEFDGFASFSRAARSQTQQPSIGGVSLEIGGADASIPVPTLSSGKPSKSAAAAPSARASGAAHPAAPYRRQASALTELDFFEDATSMRRHRRQSSIPTLTSSTSEQTRERRSGILSHPLGTRIASLQGAFSPQQSSPSSSSSSSSS
ncbi:MAG: hypothetical protein Q8P67_25200, partial [archaeon]|nr:hypothetical protein [archaeon]